MKITLTVWLTLLLILPSNAYALQVLKCRSQGHTLTALEFKKVSQNSHVYKIIEKLDPMMFECMKGGINGFIKDRSTGPVYLWHFMMLTMMDTRIYSCFTHIFAITVTLEQA